jgi:hypothetical protein
LSAIVLYAYAISFICSNLYKITKWMALICTLDSVHARYAFLGKVWVMNELGMEDSLSATFTPDGYFSGSRLLHMG